MANPSFYKPRKDALPKAAGAEVDSSVSLLLLGVVGLLALLVTFLGLNYTAQSPKTPVVPEASAPMAPDVDISAPVQETPAP